MQLPQCLEPADYRNPPELHIQRSDSNRQSKLQALSSFDAHSGVIRGEWRRSDGRIQSICYGTGIAISKRVVLTCGHSVFLEKKRKICDTVTFIPNHNMGRLTHRSKVYTSAKHDFIKLEVIQENQSFSKYPLPEDIALIYLSQDLDFESFPEVGTNNEEELRVKGEVRIVGFPSMSYFASAALREIDFTRVSLRGQLLETAKDTFFHNCDTQTGHSGSGALAHNTQTGEVTVIGVHTHKGRHRNSGVFLSNAVLMRLARYEVEFGLKHEEYDLSINFPERIKEEAFWELSEERRQVMCSRNKFYEKIWRGDDFENSVFEAPFSLWHDDEYGNQEDQEEEFLRPLKEKDSDDLSTRTNELQELLANNHKFKEQLLHTKPECQELLQKWLKIENNFLEILHKMPKAATNILTPKQKSLNRELIDFCKSMERELSELKEKLTAASQIQVLHIKIASVTEYLGRCFNEQLEEEYFLEFTAEEQNGSFHSEAKSSSCHDAQTSHAGHWRSWNGRSTSLIKDV